MRLAYLPFVALLVSCRAACGLDELAGAGGAGAGGGGVGGASTTDVASAGGGGTGAAGGGGTGGAGGGVLCAEETGCSLCADEFTTGPDPSECLFVREECRNSGGGCPGDWTIDRVSGHLSIRPGPESGFWNGWSSIYVHTEVPVPGPEAFVARTLVRTNSSLSAGWPDAEFQLAGIVVSTSTDATDTSSPNWFKAEYGTLENSATRGLRTARRMQGGNLGSPPSDGRIADSVDGNGLVTPPWIEVAVCRTDDGTMHGFFIPPGDESWTAVAPTDNPPLTDDVYVGLVAAAGSTTADLYAEFDYFELVALPSLADDVACVNWLEAHPPPPAQ